MQRKDKNNRISESELILNQDGSVYHIALHGNDIADTVLVVGDPGRVNLVSRHFDVIELRKEKREFVTHTGRIGSTRLTVVGTGIGPDNIDIVLNELDAAVNIDPETRTINPEKRSLNIIRMGTTGSLQPDIPVDSLVVSAYACGLDGVLHFYDGLSFTDREVNLQKAIEFHTNWPENWNHPYIIKSSPALFNKLKALGASGITLTAPGFYGPQGRAIRANILRPDINDLFESFRFEGERIVNYEMETSVIYGLSRLLGHQCCTVCAVIANRPNQSSTTDYQGTVSRMITGVLDQVT